MKKEDLTPILRQTFFDFLDCFLSAYESFFTLDYTVIKNSMMSFKFGNFNLFDVIGTQQGTEYVIDNFGLIYRNKVYKKNLFSSIFILQSIRSIINKPIIVNSFFRSEELNSLLKGVKNSYHTKGLAFDIKRTDFINRNSVLNALKKLKNIYLSYPEAINIIDKVQIIEYNSFLHIELEIEA